MKTKSTLGRAVLASAAAATALVAVTPTIAAAQSYGYGGYSSYDNRGGYAYDGCRREQNSRSTLGALAGAAAGIALGNNVSRDRSSRRNAAAVGGVLGAVIGSQVGKNGAACTPGYDTGYYDRSYVAPPATNYGYYERSTQYDRSYDRDYYDRYQQRYAQGGAYARDYAPPSQYDTASRCTYAESPVYMPDGTTQTRMVQVCPDRTGRYQVVQ